MKKSALKNYFDGTLSIEELRDDLKGTIEKTSCDVLTYTVETLNAGSYELNEKHILKICDAAIDGSLNPMDLDVISFTLIGSDYFDWDSERITETITDWNNQTINFPVTSTNLELWKHYLTSGEYKLPEYNNWNVHIEPQKQLCQQHQAAWSPINKKSYIGIGGDLVKEPLNGLRHPSQQGTTGWFIWAGDYSEREDFFKPLCAEHLLQLKPQLIKFLGLPAGFRFLTDNDGYIDIWKDEKLLEV